MLIAITAQQFDTAVYNHVTNLLHVSAFFDHPQGGIRQRKNNIGLCSSVVLSGLCPMGICQCCVFLCHIPT